MPVEARGTVQLERLSKALKEAGRKDLQQELSRGIADAMKPLRNQLRVSALTTLPSHGGLARKVAASQFRVVRRPGRGIRFQATNRNASLQQLDKGTVRHPVFGNREVWVTQTINADWWSGPVDRAAPQVRRQAVAAIDRVAKKVERSV